MQGPKDIISKYIEQQLKELQGEINSYNWRMSHVYFGNEEIKQTKIGKK